MRLTVAVVVGLVAGALPAHSAESKIFKPGTWAQYRMEMKLEGGGTMGAPGMPGGGMDAGAMLKEMDMKLKYSVTGEEERDGKPHVWLEIFCSGKKPDVDKLYGNMLGSLPPEHAKKAKAGLEKAKRQMAEQPMFTKDGKMKMAMRLLVEKPDPDSSVFMTFSPVEIWQKWGDQTAKQLPEQEVKDFSADSKKSKEEYEVRLKKDGGSVKSDIKSKPGMSMAFGVSGIMGRSNAMTKRVEEIGKVKMEEEKEERVVSKEITPVGMEEIEVPVAGKVKALHLQVKIVKELITKAKTEELSMDRANLEKQQAEIKGKTQEEMQEQMGATKTGKLLGGAAKVGGFLSDPLGVKRKKGKAQAKQMEREMNEGMQAEMHKNFDGMQTTSGIKIETVEDIWINPSVPGLGMAKYLTAQQEGGRETSMQLGAGASPEMQQMMQAQLQMSQAYAQQYQQGAGGASGAQPRTSTEMVLDAVGDAGAKSEF